MCMDTCIYSFLIDYFRYVICVCVCVHSLVVSTFTSHNKAWEPYFTFFCSFPVIIILNKY